MFVLVAYDISDDKRLHRVAKLMKRYGRRVQRSVFECSLNRGEILKLTDEIEERIKRKQDRVHFYFLCEECREQVESWGLGGITIDPDVYIL